MLNPSHGFKESQVNESSDLKEIRLAADSFKSAQVVMNVIHHQNSRIPGRTEIDLESLYNLSSFCDCYNFQEAMALAVQIWAGALWSSVSSKLPLTIIDRDFIRWLWIGKTFSIREILEKTVPFVMFQIKSTNNTLVLGDIAFHSGAAIWNERERRIRLLTDLINTKFAEIQHDCSGDLVLPQLKAISKDMLRNGLLFTLKLQMGYQQQNLDHLTLREVFDLAYDTISNARITYALSSRQLRSKEDPLLEELKGYVKSIDTNSLSKYFLDEHVALRK
ncbi:hypothetical protein ABW20_dc0106160 [Dactylellina cionopaga]|nr:hypothetical protein ABW20_dc0106160 [Dactylellina cionopaga]